MTQEYYRLSVEEISEQLGVNPAEGLSPAEAAARLERNGANEFAKTKHTSLLVKFLSQFKSFMILVLMEIGQEASLVILNVRNFGEHSYGNTTAYRANDRIKLHIFEIVTIGLGADP